jgi:hypothetical protein
MLWAIWLIIITMVVFAAVLLRIEYLLAFFGGMAAGFMSTLAAEGRYGRYDGGANINIDKSRPSRIYMHESKSIDKPDVESFNTTQMELLNDIYRKSLIAKAILDYIGSINDPIENYKLREIMEKVVMINYNSIGEFYALNDASKNILKADLVAAGADSRYEKILDILSMPTKIEGEEYLTGTISHVEIAKGFLPYFYEHVEPTEYEENSEVQCHDAKDCSEKIDQLMTEVSYSELTAYIPQYRIAMLRRYGDDIDIILAVMRYYCLLPCRQHITLPLSFYREYVKLGATIECFASPFNSQIMRLETVSGQYRYCSIFDEDVVFNSLGSYFNVKLGGRFIILNPPKIDNILSSAAKKCITERDENAESKFIFHGPYWPDSEYYKLMKEYSDAGKARMEVLQPDQYHYENLYTNKKIKPSEALVVIHAY